MAENPRELIRAAQSAELRGDVTRAVECLQQAAAFYRNAGNAPRALQLLRHARRLDTSRLDILEEVNRLEGMTETLLPTQGGEEEDDGQLVLSVEDLPLPELVRRQRLIQDALRDVESQPTGKSPELAAWVLDTEVSEDLQRLEAQLARVAASVDPGASEVQKLHPARSAASVEPGASEGQKLHPARSAASMESGASEGQKLHPARSAASVESGASEQQNFHPIRSLVSAESGASAGQGFHPVRSAASVDPGDSKGLEFLSAQREASVESGDSKGLEFLIGRSAASAGSTPRGMVPSVARDALPSRGSEFVRAERSHGAVDEQLFESRWRPGSPEGEEPFSDGVLAPTGQAEARDSDVEAFAAHASEDDTTPRRRRGPRIIERGPARADAALDAWCSFCCRPRAEVGDLVAGPAGAFICKACLTESASLLGDVSPVPLPTRPRSPVRASAAMDFVGQPDVRSSMERALQSGARCILLVGAEGWGKSVLLQMLQRQGRGILTPVASLAEDLSASPLFVEDVDRLSTEHQTALSVFLARESRPSVVLSARGLAPEPGKLILRGGEERLLVPTTEALSRAVRGVIPVSILEHVQVLLSLHPPTREDYVEMARARLSLRESATSLSDSVLSAFAAEAERSPRAGHELQALLQRVPPGTWELENVTKPTPPRKGRRKGTS
ncbi:ClpX C4-type zinc finger protein [Myxococcus sp. CA039A]|uniref:ClpX C4-type zinc finger protein n=1 Tax=Myxococcus sp. CA039A TaxID=2741737 RepID=UPI00157B57C2|nr:ClpX C4-type zinc finger protein [Myxococcus sp. CA039A]NTX52835.1 hypothetical protein [Myxococcus sp. CA039A]